MAQKPSFLKRITTASTVAFAAAAIVGTGSTAFGAGTKTADATPAAFTTAANWVEAVVVGDGDSVIATKANQVINADDDTTVTFNTAAIANVTVNVGNNTVGVAGVVGGKTLKIVATNDAANIVLGLNGVAAGGFAVANEVGSYVGLSTIDFGNTGANVSITTDNFNSNVDFLSTGGNNGTLTINATGVVLGGEFSNGAATKVKNLIVEDGKSVTINGNNGLVLSGTVTLKGVAANAGGSLTIGAGKNLIATDVAGQNAGTGTLAFEGASTVTNGIGNGNALNIINIGAGTVEFKGGTNAVVKATNIKLTDATSAMKLSTVAQTVTGNIVNTSANNNSGSIIVDGANHSITGTIGAKDKSLAAINFTGNTQLTLTNPGAANAAATDLYVKAITTIAKAGGNGNGTLVLDGNYNIYSTIGTANNPLNVVSILNTIHTDPTTTTLKTGNSIDATTLQLTAVGGKSNTLALEADTTVNAAITTGVTNNGVITLVKVGGNAGIVTINGNIGNTTNNKAINAINLAGNNLVFGGNTIFVDAGNINFAGGDILTLNDSVSPALQIKANIALAVAGNNGAIDASTLTDKQTLTISGTIGAADRSLNSLLVGQSKVILNAGDAYINTLDMGDNASVQLDHNTYKISKITGQGTINVAPGISANAASNTTLVEGTNLGSAASPLKAIAFISGFNDTLIVGKDISLYAANITAKTANNGSFEFNGGGTSIVGGQVGTAASKLNTVAITNGTTVQFKNSVFFAGATTIDATSTLQIGGAYQADSIGGVAADQGTVEFVNTTPITLNPTNAGNAISTIKVSGSDNVTLTKEFGAKNIAFGKDSPRVALSLAATDKIQGVTITSAAGGIGNAPVVVTSLAGGDSIDADQAVGDANNIVNIELGGDIAFTVNEGTNFFGGIAPVNNGQGTVTLNAANGGQVYGLGLPGQKLKTVIVSKNTTNFGDTYVSGNTLQVDDNTIHTSGGIIDAGIQLGSVTGVGSKIVFKNGTNLLSTSTVKALVANNGTATFQGSAQVGNLGVSGTSLALVEFTGPDGSKASLQGAIYSQNINLNNYDIAVVSNSTLSGASAINGNINLNTNVLTFAGGVSTWAEDTTITTTFTNASSAGFPNGTLGNIVIKDGGSVTAAGTIRTLIVDNQGDINVTINNASSIYPFITGGANLTSNGQPLNLVNADTIVTSNQQFIKWNLVKSGTDYVLQPSDNRNAVIANAFTTNPVNIPGLDDNIATLTNIKNTGNASATITNFGNFKSSADLTQAIVAVVTDVDALIDNVIDNTTEHFSSIIGNRVEVARYAQLPVGAPEGVLARPEGGVVGAADDADDNVSYGTWLKPVYTDATQKGKNGTPGYNAKTTGGIFGFDTMANDNLMVGAAIGINQTKIKYKNYKSGDKSTVNGFLVSLYGAQQLVDNFFVQGGATFNLSQIKTKSKRYMADTTNGQKIAETATSNYDNMTFGGNVMLGYDAKLMDGVLLTPMAGISYLKSGDESYKETGTTLLNKEVASKFSDKTDIIVGAKVLGDVMNLSGFAFYPEAHAFVTHKVSGKYAKTQAKLDGQVDFITGLPDKSAKTSYNLGLSIAARPGPQMEYGIGYDANLASKYVAHTGTLKVRVNF